LCRADFYFYVLNGLVSAGMEPAKLKHIGAGVLMIHRRDSSTAVRAILLYVARSSFKDVVLRKSLLRVRPVRTVLRSRPLKTFVLVSEVRSRRSTSGLISNEITMQLLRKCTRDNLTRFCRGGGVKKLIPLDFVCQYQFRRNFFSATGNFIGSQADDYHASRRHSAE
jgi:hypothetical protein